MARARVRLRFRAVLLGALAAGLTVGLAAPAHAVTVGIADNKPEMFSDPRFLAAGIRFVRLSVGWDALSSPWQVAELDAWLGAARAANVVPLVSFGHSRTNRRSLPTPERYLFEFRRFRARYPWVTEFAAWNEANHCGEPTCHRPRLVAAFYRKLRRECPTCTILAAEVLDTPNMVRWVKAFRRAAHEEPVVWGLHNYVDANRRRTRGTRRLLRAVRGHVWFTETGGIVARHNPHRITFPESAHHAAVATRFVFRRLAPLSRRVTRVYIYQWNAGPPPTTWDSALIGPTGRVRPAWSVVEHALAVQAARQTAGQTGGATPLPRRASAGRLRSIANATIGPASRGDRELGGPRHGVRGVGH
jgi:polysaccharide biosynthesis protein PslG